MGRLDQQPSVGELEQLQLEAAPEQRRDRVAEDRGLERPEAGKRRLEGQRLRCR